MSKKSKGGQVRCKDCGIQCKLKNLKSCKREGCELMELKRQIYPDRVPTLGQENEVISEKALSFNIVREHFKKKGVRIVKAEEIIAPDVPAKAPKEDITDVPWMGG